MAALPIARVAASTEKQNPIRNAVSTTESLAGIAEVARARHGCADCATSGPADIRANLHASRRNQLRNHRDLYRPSPR